MRCLKLTECEHSTPSQRSLSTRIREQRRAWLAAGEGLASASGTYDVLRGQRLEDGDGEDELVRLAGLHLLLNDVHELVVVDVVVEGIFDPDPEGLRHAVYCVVPFEVGLECYFDAEDGARDWMQGRVDFNVW